MRLILASVSTRTRKGKSEASDILAQEYAARASRYEATELGVFADEAMLLAAAERQPGRAGAVLVLFDSRGEGLTSEEFAELLGRSRDSGVQRIFCCIGPADGWSAATLGRATRVLSFGRMTLPHELARVVLAEQVYRALTILAGHPYHCGH